MFVDDMPIPGAELAYILPEKINDYLLNINHPVGSSKARWFISLGYHPHRPGQLARALLEIVHNSSDYVSEHTHFGVKYVVRGQFDSPGGRLVSVRTVWITERDVSQPRLVTAYPDERIEDE